MSSESHDRVQRLVERLLTGCDALGDNPMADGTRSAVDCGTVRTAVKVIESAAKLLAAAECPAHCDNGVIPEQIAEDEWQPVQCQFCAERSVFLTHNAEIEVRDGKS